MKVLGCFLLVPGPSFSGSIFHPNWKHQPPTLKLSLPCYCCRGGTLRMQVRMSSQKFLLFCGWCPRGVGCLFPRLYIWPRHYLHGILAQQGMNQKWDLLKRKLGTPATLWGHQHMEELRPSTQETNCALNGWSQLLSWWKYEASNKLTVYFFLDMGFFPQRSFTHCCCSIYLVGFLKHERDWSTKL